MVSAKAEKAIELVAKIGATRTELSQLEAEFEALFQKPKKSKPAKAEAEATHTNGKSAKTPKVQRNRLRALRILRKANAPMTCKQVQKKLGLSNSGTMYVIRQLIEAGEVISSSYGMYSAKKAN